MSSIVQQFEHSLALPFFGIGMKTDLFQFCGKDGLNKRQKWYGPEAEDIKKRWQEYTELYKIELHDQDNHDGMITHLEPFHPGM